MIFNVGADDVNQLSVEYEALSRADVGIGPYSGNDMSVKAVGGDACLGLRRLCFIKNKEKEPQ